MATVTVAYIIKVDGYDSDGENVRFSDNENEVFEIDSINICHCILPNDDSERVIEKTEYYPSEFKLFWRKQFLNLGISDDYNDYNVDYDTFIYIIEKITVSYRCKSLARSFRVDYSDLVSII